MPEQRTMERRFAPENIHVEKREDGTATLRGHAAVWYRKSDPGTEYDLGYNMVERIQKGAFARALAESQDVRGLFNHQPDHVLGRTTAGTLRLREDSKGLAYEIDLPDTQLARDLVASIERGDITGSSFAFVIRAEEWEFKKDRDIRTITEIDTLFDVGPVTFPAYAATDTGLRAVGEVSDVAAARDRALRQAKNQRLAKCAELDLH